MATFTSSTPLNFRWNGNEIVGAAGATHRIPDALADEFASEVGPRIAGFSWVEQDETTSLLTSPIAQTDVTGLTAALAGKLAVSGGTVSGALTVQGAATLSSTLVAPDIGGVIYADRYSTLAAALTAGAGGVVYIPEGTYALSSTLSPASNTRLSGAGPGTVITMSANLPIIQCAASASGIIVENLRLVGSATSASSTAFGVYSPTGCKDIRFENLIIESCFRGVAVAGTERATVRGVRVVSDQSTTGGAIDVSNSTSCVVEACQVDSPRLHGIDFREGGGYNRAISCTVRSAGTTGFVISGSANTGVSLPGCEFIGCQSIVAGSIDTANGCGFIVENGARYSRVVGCYSGQAALTGILVSQGTGDRPANNIISGSVVSAAGLHGIYAFNTNYTVIDGCRVANTTSGDGIRVNTDVQITGAATVTGCIVSDMQSTTSAGIRLTGTQEGATVAGCAIRNVAGYGVYVDAPRSIVSGTSVLDADSGGTLTIGGITLTTNADRSVVNGCTSHRSSGTKQDYGVDVQSGCTSAVVTSCVLATNTTGGLLDNGTTTSTNNNITS